MVQWFPVKLPLRRLVAAALIGLLLIGWPLGATASRTDDRFDGNIFALYAGNGSIVPARVTLQDSLQRHRPAVLAFYLDDSRDCKRFSTVISQLQAPYSRSTDIIAVNIDSILPSQPYPADDARHYYRGQVPQTVLIDQQGKVVFDEVGEVPYEQLDGRLRRIFNLAPAGESKGLKQRAFNEFNSELAQ
jgi:hypothetical protein